MLQYVANSSAQLVNETTGLHAKKTVVKSSKGKANKSVCVENMSDLEKIDMLMKACNEMEEQNGLLDALINQLVK